MKLPLRSALILISAICVSSCLFDRGKDDPATDSDPRNGSAHLRGTVTGSLGERLSGVTVITENGLLAITDSAGHFVLDSVAGGSHELQFIRYGYEIEPLSVSVEDGVDKSLERTVTLTYILSSIKGTVTSRQGKPISGAGVTVPGQEITALSDNAGNFTLENIDPSARQVAAAASGIGTGTSNVSLRPGKTTQNVVIVLDRQGGSIGGTLTDDNGLPVAGATVEVLGGALSAITDKDGNYLITDIPEGVPVTLQSENGASVSGLVVGENSKLDGIGLTPLSRSITGSAIITDNVYFVPDTGTVTVRAGIYPQPGTALENNVGYFIWDFDGDGSPDSITSSPVMRFSSDLSGSTSVFWKGISIDGSILGGGEIEINRVSIQPQALTGGPVSAAPMAPVTLVGESVCLTGGIVSYQWDFNGDGLYDWIRSDQGTVTYRYFTAGTYRARLLVTAADSSWDTATVAITISGSPQAVAAGETAPPAILSPANGSTVPQDALISWFSPKADSFSVFIDITPPPAAKAGSVRNSSEFPLTGLIPYQVYFLQVIAHFGAVREASFVVSFRVSGNAPPVFNLNSNTLSVSIPQGQAYLLDLSASDDDGDSLLFELLEHPAGMTLSRNRLAWNPGTPDLGTHAISVQVSDGNGGLDTLSWTLTVIPGSSASLSSLETTPPGLFNTFNPAVHTYSASVPFNVSQVIFRPITLDAGALIQVNGSPVASDELSPAISLSSGVNTITVIVTAQDQTTKSTYTFTVTRGLSSNASLSGLYLSQGSLSPLFHQDSLAYSASVSSSTGSLTVSSTASQTGAGITVNGSAVLSDSASSPILLVSGANTITIVVTAPDGITQKTYTVRITRPLSSDATLKSVSLSTGLFAPDFDPDTLQYSATVANASAVVSVTATAGDASSVILINSLAAASGTASAPIALLAGANTITISVTAPDGTRRIYTFTINRLLNSNALLSALATVPAGVFVNFDPLVFNYSAQLPFSTDRIAFRPATTDAGATLMVNGNAVASGALSPEQLLSTGSNAIVVSATSQNRVTKTDYTFNITRAGNNPDLSALTLSQGTLNPPFHRDSVLYTVNVGNAVSSLTITPTLSDALASLTINSVSSLSGTPSASLPLSTGTNIITVAVSAQDGTLKNYRITIYRAPSSDARLSGLTLSQGTLNPGFNSATLSYAASVINTVSSITASPTAAGAAASITVNGVAVLSGSPSQNLPLATGGNIVTIDVTAEDGATHGIYTVTVTRAPHIITASAGTEGTITPSGSVQSVDGGVASFTITPSAGYAVNDVLVDGLSAGAVLNYTFPNVTGNHTISAQFRDSQAPSVLITSPAGPIYSTTAAAVTLDGSGSDNVGVTSVTWSVTGATAGSGTAFGTSPWNITNAAILPGTSVFIVTAHDAGGNTSADTLTVTRLNVYQITASAGTGGTIAPSGNVSITQTHDTTFTITPSAGYAVSNVLVNGISKGALTSYTFTNMQGDSTISASFVDIVKPALSIGAPTSNRTYATTGLRVDIGGTASDAVGVTSVTWQATGATTGAGTATGTTGWNMPQLTLSFGVTDVIVTAHDAAGNTGADTLTITRSDPLPPTVTITAPDNRATFFTGDATVNLSGTATDNIGIKQVSYVLTGATTGNGTAAGTMFWSITSLPLNIGLCTLTVTASDSSSNTARDTIVLQRTTNNIYVDLGIASVGSGADGSKTKPYGYDEFLSKIFAGYNAYMTGQAAFGNSLTLNDRVFYLRAWTPGQPWRINTGPNSIDFANGNIYDGIVWAVNLSVNGADDCYLNIGAGGVFNEMTGGAIRCVFDFNATMAASYGIFDRGVTHSSIISPGTQPVRGIPTMAFLPTGDLYTNRANGADLVDANEGVLYNVTFGFSFSVAPVWNEPALPSFSRAAPTGFIPRWSE